MHEYNGRCLSYSMKEGAEHSAYAAGAKNCPEMAPAGSY